MKMKLLNKKDIPILAIMPDQLKKFAVDLGLLLLLTQPQFFHFLGLMMSFMQDGFNGKIFNVPEYGMPNIHRTSVGRYLADSPWSTSLIIAVYQGFVIRQILIHAKKTGCPVFVILDDTVVEHAKPSPNALNPIEGCGKHWSNLKKRTVYGHQIAGVLLVCGDLKLPLYLEVYDKSKQSKIEMACNAIKLLPKFPTQVFVLGDRWYSGDPVIKATISKKFDFVYIGALKSDRVIHTPGGLKWGLPVDDYVKKLTKTDVHLVTVGNRRYWIHRVNGYNKKLPKGSVILISWPEKQLFQEQKHRVFCSTRDFEDQFILNTYSDRWTIEVFFRSNKMKLHLARYQIRTMLAIRRYLVILLIAYAYCSITGLEGCLTLTPRRLEERREMKSNLVDYVFHQAQAGVPLPQIKENLGVA